MSQRCSLSSSCLSFSMKLLSLLMNLAATRYLLEPELSSSVFSSRYSKRPLRSTKLVMGTSDLVLLALLFLHSSREGDRLVADGSDDVDVALREPEYSA